MSRGFIPAAKLIIGQEERGAVDAVLTLDMVVQEPQIKAFEEEFFAQVVDGVHCVAVSSDTSAQHVTTLASKLQKRAGGAPGVIAPSFTFAATGNSVVISGAVLVFTDIDPVTLIPDPASVETSITERTTVIEVAHLYGLSADMPETLAIVEHRGLAVFEGCAQAHGATIEGKPVGTSGTWGSFFFYPTKNMTSLEGGMTITANAGLARRCRLTRNQGIEQQYTNELVGLNNRMTDVAATVGRVQLTKLVGWTAARQANTVCLNELLAGAGDVVIPFVPEGYTHVYHQHTTRLEGATGTECDAVQAVLREEWQVGSGAYYPIPNHRLASLAHYTEGLELLGTEKAARECLSLPVHPSLSEADLERISQAVAAIVKAST